MVPSFQCQIVLLLVVCLLRLPPCRAQFGAMIQLEINPDSMNIPVLSVQEKVGCIIFMTRLVVMSQNIIE